MVTPTPVPGVYPLKHPVLGTEREAVPYRIIAFILDLIFLLVLSVVIIFFCLGLTIAVKVSNGLSIILVIVTVLLLWALYSFVMEGWIGQTIGKMAVNIIVVKEDGSPCGFLSSFVRNLFRIVDGFPFCYLVGFIVIAITEKRQRVGDILANTVVVRASPSPQTERSHTDTHH